MLWHRKRPSCADSFCQRLIQTRKYCFSFNVVKLWQANDPLYVFSCLPVISNIFGRKSVLQIMFQTFPYGLHGQQNDRSCVDTHLKTHLLKFVPPEIRTAKVTVITRNIYMKKRSIDFFSDLPSFIGSVGEYFDHIAARLEKSIAALNRFAQAMS